MMKQNIHTHTQKNINTLSICQTKMAQNQKIGRNKNFEINLYIRGYNIIGSFMFIYFLNFLLFLRLPIVSDCPAGQTDRIASNLHSPSSSSTMAVSRVPSPPLPEVNTPVAENWCYTQASIGFLVNDEIALSLIAITI